MRSACRNVFHVAPQHQALVREIGLDAEAIFDRADIKPWRKLDDRENCIFDATAGSGTSVRLHVKRFGASAKGTPVADEVRGIETLARAGIRTVPLVGWGTLADGRSFVVTLDLEGYRDAEKMVQAKEATFDELLEPTARVASELHASNLHHRDLYLCHFFAKRGSSSLEIALIDAARVKRLPRFFRDRWIVKDLAQFWYSTTSLTVSHAEREAWLMRYAEKRGLSSTKALKRAVERKVRWIARHDERLNAKQPTRNVSIS
jgi:hypothetical protein